MSKSRYLKAAIFAAVACTPLFASADVVESMREAATKVGALETGIEAIGAVAIGIAVTIKGYSVGKRMINRV